jgi:hypothetical protein
MEIKTEIAAIQKLFELTPYTEEQASAIIEVQTQYLSMLRALKAVQWDTTYETCPDCYCSKFSGHDETCRVGAAIELATYTTESKDG